MDLGSSRFWKTNSSIDNRIQSWNAGTTGRTALWGVKLHGCQEKRGHDLEKTLGLGSARFLSYHCKCIPKRKQRLRRARSPGGRQASPDCPTPHLWGELVSRSGGLALSLHQEEAMEMSHSVLKRQSQGFPQPKSQTSSEAEAWLKSGLLFNA